MNQAITLELSPEAITGLTRRAKDAGVAPAQLAAATLEQQYGSRLTPAEATAARERFERQIGAIDMSFPLGADNDAIDADLARAYGEGV